MLRLWKELHIRTLSANPENRSNAAAGTASRASHKGATDASCAVNTTSMVDSNTTSSADCLQSRNGCDGKGDTTSPATADESSDSPRQPTTGTLPPEEKNEDHGANNNTIATSSIAIKPQDEMMLLLEPNGRGAWRLKRNLRLHLYISDPPCGDASIYEQATPAAPAPTQAPAQESACSAGDDGARSTDNTRGKECPGEVHVVMSDSGVEDGYVFTSSSERAVYIAPGLSESDTAPAGSGTDRGIKRHRCASKQECSAADDNGSIEQGESSRDLRVDTAAVAPSEMTMHTPTSTGMETQTTEITNGATPVVVGTETAIPTPPTISKKTRESGTIPETPSTGMAARRNPSTTERTVTPATVKMAFTGAKIAPAVGETPTDALGVDQPGGDNAAPASRDDGDEAKWTGDVGIPIVREQEQTLGVLRIKSSRSNISEEGRTLSMSCSDKLAKWSVLGLQVSFFTSAVLCTGQDNDDGTTSFSAHRTYEVLLTVRSCRKSMGLSRRI